ncbi:MAG: hypothetical protein ABIQ64_03875 [Candidatus Saccharimonadales bacterium]
MKQQYKTGFRAATAFVGVAAIALAPVAASAVAATANTTVNAIIASTISVTSSGTVNLNITPVSGGSQTSASDTVTVNTNNATGYNLAVKDADATLTLTNGANTIAASANTFTAGAALANNTWGWAVPSGTTGIGTNNFDASYSVITNAGTSASTWTGITASDQVFKNTTTTASNDVTTVWYSAKADTSKPNGTYADVVTYTATTNP